MITIANDALLTLNLMTSKVFIDSNGDAEGNYTVVSMLRVGNESDEIQYVMQPVGYFQYNINTSTNDLPVRFALSAQLFRPLDVATLSIKEVVDAYLLSVPKVFSYFNSNRPIDWIGKEPPISEPPCGFTGEKCDQRTQPDWRTFVICTVSAVVLIVAIGLVSR